MRLSYKYRIYPNKSQREALASSLETLRLLYNSALEERQQFYSRYGKSRSYASQCSQFKNIKPLFPEFENIYSQTSQQTLKQVDTAYQNFFRRVKTGASAPGFPRFKQFGRFKSLLFPQPKADLSGAGGVSLRGKKLRVFGIQGEIPVKLHRALPEGARCKQVRISREGEQFFVIFSLDGLRKEPIERTGKIAAYDLGITTFLMQDDGTKFHHPRPLKRQRDRLIKQQRDLASKKRGSNNRERAKRSLARTHLKVSNIRKDFSQKLATQLLRQNDCIILEDLNVSGMLQKEASRFVRKDSISDVSWSMFSEVLSYKAVKADKKVIFVDPRNTSKMCSRCGHIKDMPLTERHYSCGNCGLEINRDLNAAINIRRLGLSLLWAEFHSAWGEAPAPARPPASRHG